MNGIEFLLDTNVIIGVLNQSPEARSLADQYEIAKGGIAVSQISRIELLSFPSLSTADEAAIRDFLSDSTVLPIDERIDAEAIAFRRLTRIRLPDAIIAATARAHGLKLVTLDKRLMVVLEGWIGHQP